MAVAVVAVLVAVVAAPFPIKRVQREQHALASVVEHDGARSTLALLAGVLRPKEAEL